LYFLYQDPCDFSTTLSTELVTENSMFWLHEWPHGTVLSNFVCCFNRIDVYTYDKLDFMRV